MTALVLFFTLQAASLNSAQSAFDRGEFDDALKQLAPLVASLGPGKELGAVHLLRGRCFAALRQPAQVETAFTLALMNDPEAKLDENRVAPELVQTLAALAVRLSGRLTLALDGLQPGDELRDGGEVVSSGTRTTSIGRHTLTVQREGRVVWTSSVLVRPGQETVVKQMLPSSAPKSAPTPTEPPRVENPTPADSPVALGPFSVSARMRIDPARGVAFDVGVELTLPFFRVALLGTRGQFWGAALRPSFVWRFNDRFALSAFGELGLFASSPASLVVGGGVAFDARLVAGFELFLDGGAFYVPLAPVGIRQAYGLIGLGARYRF